MSKKYEITGKNSLVTKGSASGKTVGPLGIHDTYVSSSKIGILGINDSADPEYARKQEIEKLLKKYRAIINKGRSMGKNVAADMLEHWLNGYGSDKKLDCNWLRTYDSIIETEDINKKKI